MHRPKEVVFAVVEHVAVDGHARRHQFGDAALHQFLGEFRILKLLADSHTLAGAHESWQIGVKSVVGKSRQLDVLTRTVGTLGERDAQDFRRGDGIGRKRFIEVAHAIEQNGIRMLFLHLEELLHQRGLNNFFICHCYMI